MKTRLFKRGEIFMISNWTRHVKSCSKKGNSKSKDGFHKSISGSENNGSLISSDCESDCSSSLVRYNI